MRPNEETYSGKTARTGFRLAGLSTGGSFLAGLGVAACCLGPPVLAALGVGGMAFAVRLAPLRPYFLVAAVLLLASAFYLVYGRMERACREDGRCVPSRVRRWSRVMLWTAAGALVVFATSEWWIGLLIP